MATLPSFGKMHVPIPTPLGRPTPIEKDVALSCFGGWKGIKALDYLVLQ